MATVTKERTRGQATAGEEPDGIVILLVDDDPDCRMLIREAIAECKIVHRIYEVADGRDALDFIFRRGQHRHAPRPGLVFLDIEMPELDGQEVLRQIKTSPQHRDIPVVMMTGVCDEQEMEKAARNGANSYTIKPANPDQFLRTVLASANYWVRIHQYPERHLPASECRR